MCVRKKKKNASLVIFLPVFAVDPGALDGAWIDRTHKYIMAFNNAIYRLAPEIAFCRILISHHPWLYCTYAQQERIIYQYHIDEKLICVNICSIITAISILQKLCIKTRMYYLTNLQSGYLKQSPYERPDMLSREKIRQMYFQCSDNGNTIVLL